MKDKLTTVLRQRPARLFLEFMRSKQERMMESRQKWSNSDGDKRHLFVTHCRSGAGMEARRAQQLEGRFCLPGESELEEAEAEHGWGAAWNTKREPNALLDGLRARNNPVNKTPNPTQTPNRFEKQFSINLSCCRQSHTGGHGERS